MTEAEWLTCSDPEPMLEFLRNKASDRKLRLFAVGAFISRGFDLRDASKDDVVQEAQQAVMVAELYADGHLPEQTIEEARKWLFFQVLLRPQAWSAAKQSCMATINLSCRKGTQSVVTMSGRLSSLLRELFGNPFRPVALTSVIRHWNDSILTNMAQGIYDERAFDRLPILADALEEAGCTDLDVLNHCRQPREHFRGCWVVDLLLDKK